MTGIHIRRFQSKRGREDMNKTVDMIKDPKNIIVHTEDRYLKGPTARVVSKRVLRNAVTKNCEWYKNDKCKECLIDAQEIPNPCGTAWTLTIGKGKKLY